MACCDFRESSEASGGWKRDIYRMSKSVAVEAARVVDMMNRTKRIVSPFNSVYGQPGRHAKSGIYATVFGSYGFLGTHVMGKLGTYFVVEKG